MKCGIVASLLMHLFSIFSSLFSLCLSVYLFLPLLVSPSPPIFFLSSLPFSMSSLLSLSFSSISFTPSIFLLLPLSPHPSNPFSSSFPSSRFLFLPFPLPISACHSHLPQLLVGAVFQHVGPQLLHQRQNRLQLGDVELLSLAVQRVLAAEVVRPAVTMTGSFTNVSMFSVAPIMRVS